ncbi:MAG: HD domain-containing protein [Firmicutes bacterium]|nr:HD domain-containing protein [Bacillota bacterium]
MLKKINIDYLTQESILQFDIYNFQNNVLLLKTGETLTAEKIENIKKFNSDNGVVGINPNAYKSFFKDRETPLNVRQKIFEDEFGYTKICEDIMELFIRWTKLKYINYKLAGDIMESIYKKSRESSEQQLFQCIMAPSSKGWELCRHSLNVAFLNIMLGKWLGLQENDIKLLIYSGMLHDVGKVKANSYLSKVTSVSPSEKEKLMKSHPTFSYEILNLNDRFNEKICFAARNHHENIDGSGYPDGLAGDDIPFFARITAITDTYENAIFSYAYDEPFNHFKVYKEFLEQEFIGLDMRIVAIFLKNIVKKMSGLNVLLSNGSVGTIKKVDIRDLEHPFVTFGTAFRKTDDTVYCKQIVLK